MHFLRLPVVFAVLAVALTALAEDPLSPEKEFEEQLKKQALVLAELGKQATHVSIAEVKVTGTDGTSGLQTLCADADGRVLALVAPPRAYGAPLDHGFGEVHVYGPDGKPVSHWSVSFHAHSINVGPDGTVYVAGDGKVARFDKAGKAIGDPFELPHIADAIKDEAGLRKKVEARLKRENEQQAEYVKKAGAQFEERVKTIEAKKESDRTRSEVRQLEQAKMLLKELAADFGNPGPPRTVEDVMRESLSRMRVINGICVSATDVFVACGEIGSYGYGVWRMDRDLKNPKKVLGDLGGCCGQIDIQCSGPDLLVAENTKHQFARYDREGKPLGVYGKRAQDADPAGFGGCCNPMNVRACAAGGDVLTAESEGVVKRFSPAGEFRGVVGTVDVKGGCKNVAIAVSPDGERLYFCDPPGSRFFILARKPAGKKD